MNFRNWFRLPAKNSIIRSRKAASKQTPHFRLTLETLEDRTLPSAYMVTTTADSGAGSLRYAITQTNADTSHALYASLSNPSVDEIDFAITTASDAASGGTGYNATTGVATIAPTSAALPTITNPVVINGTTQAGFAGAPIIELDGTHAGSDANGLFITAGNSTVRGLVINRFGGYGILLQSGGSDLIAGNYVGTDVSGTLDRGNALSGILILSSDNTVGGTVAGDRNVVSGNHGTRNTLPIVDGGISIASADYNVVEGNLVGTNAAGTGPLPNTRFGIVVAGTSRGNFIGDPNLPSARNVVSGNLGAGIGLGLGAVTNLVVNNYVGTDITGELPIGNRTNGIVMQFDANYNDISGNVVSANAIGVNIINSSNNSVSHNFIGTDAAGTAALGNLGNAGGFGPGVAIQGQTGGSPASNNGIVANVIAANKTGVWMQGSGAYGNHLYGNYIGTNAAGATGLGNLGNGVQLVPIDENTAGANNNTIGVPGNGNVIANNGLAGILLTNFNSINHNTGGGVTGNLLAGNSIHDNGGLGIDLGGDGVTVNDSAGHFGPNYFQNFPDLASAASSSTSTVITGTFTEAARTYSTITVDFYANPAQDPSGYGEGKTYLGSRTVFTDSDGHASFSAVFAVGTVGQWITATARDSSGNTSEFSQNIPAADAPGQTFTQSLAAALPQSATGPNTLTIQANANSINDVVSALATTNLGQSVESVSVYLNLALGSYSPQTVSVPTGMTLYINGTPGTTIDPASPAFTVASGSVVVSNVTFVTTGDAPTILVTGGSLTLRNDVIQESTGYSQAAIAVTGGTVDLGTASDPGGNTLIVNGPGVFVANTGPNPVSAVGDTYVIIKASSTTTATGGTFTYDGHQHAGSDSVNVTGGVVTHNYVGINGTTYSSTTAPTNAGSYTVTVTYAGDVYHTGSSASATIIIQPKLLDASAWSQGTINIGSNGSIVLHVSIATAQLYGSDSVFSLFNGATFTIAVQNANGTVTYGTLTSTARVETDGSITVAMQMNDSLRADLYDAYVSGRAVNFNMTATANGGNYAIDEDTMSKLLNNGALRYVL